MAISKTTAEAFIIKQLTKGKTQQNISALLKEKGIEPNSLSYVEKFLKKIKHEHKAKTMFHLGFIIANLKN